MTDDKKALATFDFLLPLMGEGIHEATVVRWFKEPGESVKKDEPLVEVSTDKVDTEIPSPVSGIVLEILVPVEGTAIVHRPMARLSTSDQVPDVPPPESQPSAKPLAGAAPSARQAAPSTSHPTPISQTPSPRKTHSPTTTSHVPASPLARRLAREHDLDLGGVTGTGGGGRITEADVYAHLRRLASVPSYVHGLPAQQEDRLVTERRPDGLEYLEGIPVRREKLPRMRRLIAEHMVRSVRVSPHVTTVFEIDLSHVAKHRLDNRERFQRDYDIKLTWTPYFLTAAVRAIEAHPIVNTSLDGEDLLWKDAVHLGCAVALESGLIVPVIKNAQRHNLQTLAQSFADLVDRARSKKLQPDEVVGGTFSVTNPGSFGSITSNPIINQPQVAILGIGAIVDRPVVVEGRIEVRPIVWVSLTFDHRVIDGEGGARYLATYRDLLQSPSTVW